ncbi:Rhodanese-related sulfurtransferase [Malonomonas rubra DSM 5091]|uniref:Rhodanese-related sulfurtransferase n=1 Tax=Malonomonas rubra DSM 5091 TaxID=1122189 RepID=A0A1M6LT01_MALRU|nr:rhodanese-like domain-containing protein [Malonomonas rubra]SHJ74295.1 Rhodanese-related sulfurtransferase [Malonomonas rubra DSM 5091]
MSGKYFQMDNRQLQDFLAAGGALVDIRREEEWQQTGIVAGSELLTFFAADGSSHPEGWLKELDRLVPLEQPLALICRTGYRTGLICDFLTEVSKRKKIYNVTNGIFGWLAEQFPVVNVHLQAK